MSEPEKSYIYPCWNGHPINTDMGPGVRGIRTVCEVCGAGLKGNESKYRLCRLGVAPELVTQWLRGAWPASTVVRNTLPDDVTIVECGRKWGDPTIWLTLHSESFSPVNPRDEVPMVPPPILVRQLQLSPEQIVAIKAEWEKMHEGGGTIVKAEEAKGFAPKAAQTAVLHLKSGGCT